jgi:hypothetical protein
MLKRVLCLSLVAVMGCGCGHVSVDPLPMLEFAPKDKPVAMHAHFLCNDDAVRFLGTNLKAAHAKALHVTLRNDSDKTFVLSKRDIVFPAKSVDLVAAREEHFTAGRAIAGWFLGGFCGGFLGSLLGLEPAEAIGMGILGEITCATTAGVLSSKHNESIRQILKESTEFCQYLPPQSSLNFVLFATEDLYSPAIDVVLREQPTGEAFRLSNHD